jgi:hypothetical protein
VDRRLFFLSLLLGAATFNLFYSFLAGLLMFGGLYGFALWATARDPEQQRRGCGAGTRPNESGMGFHRCLSVQCVVERRGSS